MSQASLPVYMFISHKGHIKQQTDALVNVLNQVRHQC